MSLHIPFDNSFAALPEGFSARLGPTSVRDPKLLVFNHDLARVMKIDGADDAELAQVFGGNQLPDGAEPLAQFYAGHQFGQFNPQLGDGRALLLGETVGTDGIRRDIQLKGSGPTPFSRRGDGRAWMGPVLREYVISEAMHALGVPTTRSLAAVSTGENVYRERPYPGAVLTRVAGSHLRVGTFQAFAARRENDKLQQLFDYAVQRHYPHATTPADFLQSVIAAQAHLVAKWLSLGFIHGVMNTDNCAISGETIDYGPCAYLDRYDPSKVFSSIDHHGRYGYSAQSDIIVWNMAQLATSLIPLVPNSEEAIEEFTALIHAMPDLIQDAWSRNFCAKIGISDYTAEDVDIVTGLLDLMHRNQADFTNTFRALSGKKARDQFSDPAAFDAWAVGWTERLAREKDPVQVMNSANPVYIPRNHRIEQMIEAAVGDDLTPMHRLLDVLAQPYIEQPGADDLRHPPLAAEVVPATFCGT